MIMVLVDYLMGIQSPKLNVPDRFEVVTYFSCQCGLIYHTERHFNPYNCRVLTVYIASM